MIEGAKSVSFCVVQQMKIKAVAATAVASQDAVGLSVFETRRAALGANTAERFQRSTVRSKPVQLALPGRCCQAWHHRRIIVSDATRNVVESQKQKQKQKQPG
jgi:hypothetical protein